MIPLLVAAVANFAVSMGGVGLWPGLGELFEEEGCFMAVEFPRSAIGEVDIGKGWSKGGFETVLFPYRAGFESPLSASSTGIA